MSKTKQKIDPPKKPVQKEFNFSFEKKVDNFLLQKESIIKTMESTPAGNNHSTNEFECGIMIAAGIKRAISRTGLSRAQIVDKINSYFDRSNKGASRFDPICRKPLSLTMFNKYLSSPNEKPIPAYYFFAINHITKSLESISAFALEEGGKIIQRGEKRLLALGQIEDHKVKIKKLRKEIIGSK